MIEERVKVTANILLSWIFFSKVQAEMKIELNLSVKEGEHISKPYLKSLWNCLLPPFS